MVEVFAHEALVVMGPDGGDPRALGAAVTVELCGHWRHEPPCPVAPHHTSADRIGDDLRVRTLFAVEPEAEDAVRQRIHRALAGRRLSTADTPAARWQVRTSGSSQVCEDEADGARRLVAG